MDAHAALHFVLAEERKRLRAFGYSKGEAESRDGVLLVPRAAFYAGAQLSRLLRLTLPAPTPAAAAAAGKRTPRHVLLYAAVDGSLGFVSPVGEGMHRRLFFLCTRMSSALPQTAGFNPLAFRAQGSGAENARQLKCVLDVVALRRYTHLDYAAQLRLAQQIGTTPAQLLANIRELELVADLI